MNKNELDLIEAIVEDEWVSDDTLKSIQVLDTLIAGIQSQAAFFKLANEINLDCDLTVVEKLLTISKCNYSAILLLYYRLRPHYYYDALRKGKMIRADGENILRIIKLIEKRIEAQQFDSIDSVGFDPRNFRQRDLTIDPRVDPNGELIPAFMKNIQSL